MQSKEIHKLRQKLMMQRYGVPNKKYINVLNVNEFMNLESFIKDNPMSVSELCNHFEVERDKMLREIREQGVMLLIDDYGDINSLKEESFKHFIKGKFPEINVIINDRKILNGRELDFYFPDNKLAVEISPTRTHNTISGYNNSPGVSKDYHLDKFIDCDNKDIELITIFDWYDWDKILRHIENKLNNYTVIQEGETLYEETNIADKEIHQLINDWHILETSWSDLNGKLISKLIKNKDIIAIALWSNQNNKTKLEKLVFKPGIKIINGINKLINNFTLNHNIDTIITFSNCDLNKGDIYIDLGFELEKESKPQLNYYNHYYKIHLTNNDLSTNSILCDKLPNYTSDNIDGKFSVLEYINNNGFLPVYDCGYRKWRLKI